MLRSTARSIAAGGLLLLFAQIPALAQEKKPQPAYVGVETCGKCHKRQSTGNQLEHWRQSKHAQAYAVLATPAAGKIARQRGVEKPQQDLRCLRCHVSAYDADSSRIAPPPEGKKGFRFEDGVQCETCHGPGSLYKKRKIMKDRDAALAAALILPDEQSCRRCHNEKSPNFKGFDFGEMWKKIAHPNPKKHHTQGG